MKLILSTLSLCLALSVSSQTGLVEAYDSECQCTKFTNHYDNGVVSATYENNSAGKRHGKEMAYFPDGQVQMERYWSNGKLNGENKHYHRNGQLYYNEIYANGNKSGTWSFYDDQGDLVQEITYGGNNEVDGVYDYYHAGVKYYTQTLIGGKLVSETVLNSEIKNQLDAEAKAASQGKKP
jgi:antitoxin component YwqK of YwqJK toxin-antitoxin module